ncbi:response regulator [Candidatus Synechococcus calcipolaris G9]|uniref:histidine kinase n=1 Tax=Candidatus Synechococcus calcipolaris G9 TaxID=1497997 RepID=A0ABT6EV60_9SYNE|nr:response regulator [Candidatus Synechococcus calcipolaris]MDG2989711.1 response regulator [Candidatus Synechococcus calcipolaris G9]
MQTDQQKRILGYFIEEAQEHLMTIEESLMNLQRVVDDPEAMSEMFRAAHSVKGGAAMLGIYSIQSTSHKLEDYFKILKEHPIKVDETLENLFLQGFDTLRELLDELQSPFGLSDEIADAALKKVEPVFESLQAHLNQLVGGGTAPIPPEPVPDAKPATPDDSSYQFVFQTDVPERLRGMLQIFKQGDTPATRQQLEAACVSLGQLGETFDLPAWVSLLGMARQGVLNSGNALTTLAPVLIKDIKSARDLVLAGQASQIQPSEAMVALQPPAPVEVEEEEVLVPEPAVETPSALELSEPESASESMSLEESILDLSEASDEPSQDLEDFGLATDDLDSGEMTNFEIEQSGDLQELDDIFSLTGDLQGGWADSAALDEQLADLNRDNSDLLDEDLSEILAVTSQNQEQDQEGELADLFADAERDLALAEDHQFDLEALEEANAALVSDRQGSDTDQDSDLDDELDLAAFVSQSGQDTEDILQSADTDLGDLSDLAGLMDIDDSELGESDPLGAIAFGSDLLEETSDSAADDLLNSLLGEELGEDDGISALGDLADLGDLDDLEDAELSGNLAESMAELLGDSDELTQALDSLVLEESETVAVSLGDLDIGQESLDLADLDIADLTGAADGDANEIFDQFTTEEPAENAAPVVESNAESNALDEDFWGDPEPVAAPLPDNDQDNDLAQFIGSEASAVGTPEAASEIAGDLGLSESLEDFDELAALLDEEPASAIAVPVEFNEPESTLKAPPSEAEDFDDLAAFLDEEPAPAIAAPVEFDDLESLLDDDSPAPALEPEPELDFGELEDLVGSTPTPRTPEVAAPRRPQPLARGREKKVSLVEQTMRVPVRHLDSLGNLVGEMVVNRNGLEDSQDRLRQFLDNLLYQVQQLGDVSQQMQDLYDRSLLESSLLGSRFGRPGGSGGTNGDDRSHATGVEFDALEMDHFTGFHTLSQEVIERIVRVREAADDIEYVVDEVEQVARMFRQVTTKVQEGLSRSRMVPFKEMSSRLPRAVRQVSQACGKNTELVIEGEDTLIDKGILERLYDPMTHLINNAIYHGIETPETRQAIGKKPKGTIKLRAFYQGSQAIIVVSDDGGGIDAERVKAKAIEKGLLAPGDAEHLSRQDIYAFLFQSGFSTKDQADDLAGRGVGMDVVRASLEEIRGTINTDSTLGKGTTFTIRLPVTLSITKALCCIDNHCRIAFPIDGVEDMLDLPEERIQENEKQEKVLVWHDRPLPFRNLSDLLPYSRHISRSNVYGGASHDEDVVSVVVLRSGDDHIAVRVDQVIGEQEIVIKQLTGPVPKPLGIAGVTVQGDGRAMAIADVLELIDVSLDRVDQSGWGTPIISPEDIEAEKAEPLVLIIDDSITVRELLSMTFTRAGFRVEQARDGQDAWEKLRSGLPCDLVFCDIEMPRMDGLELLSRIQKDPKLSELPIAMLTSRGADRHRQMAAQLGAKGYFTKPYLEEQLLDAANRLLQGEVLVHAAVASS